MVLPLLEAGVSHAACMLKCGIMVMRRNLDILRTLERAAGVNLVTHMWSLRMGSSFWSDRNERRKRQLFSSMCAALQDLRTMLGQAMSIALQYHAASYADHDRMATLSVY